MGNASPGQRIPGRGQAYCNRTGAVAGAAASAGVAMSTVDRRVVVGLDNGGNANNATVLDASGQFLVDRMVEIPSRVLEGPQVAVQALAEAMEGVLALTGVPRT